MANYDSVEFGDKIIATAVKEFGTVHILLNNAGILRDVAFKNMKHADWELVMKVHVHGSYKVPSQIPPCPWTGLTARGGHCSVQKPLGP